MVLVSCAEACRRSESSNARYQSHTDTQSRRVHRCRGHCPHLTASTSPQAVPAPPLALCGSQEVLLSVGDLSLLLPSQSLHSLFLPVCRARRSNATRPLNARGFRQHDPCGPRCGARSRSRERARGEDSSRPQCEGTPLPLWRSLLFRTDWPLSGRPLSRSQRRRRKPQRRSQRPRRPILLVCCAKLGLGLSRRSLCAVNPTARF